MAALDARGIIPPNVHTPYPFHAVYIDQNIHIHLIMQALPFIVKSVHFHRVLPAALAQCLLVVVVGGLKMKAHPLHHSVRGLTPVSAQAQSSSGSCPCGTGRLAQL